MTDQTIPDVTDNDRRLAREWAAYIESNTDYRGDSSKDPWRDRVRAAAHVILNAVPDPPRPTLADMTDEEREACKWMQADVYGFDRRMVITEVRTMSADLIERDGERWNVDLERVTPRPDLPRLEWPSDKKPDPGPALPDGWRVADHKDNGRVIVTNTTPNRDGYVCYVLPADDYALGYDWLLCKPYELTYLGQGNDTDDTERN